MRAGIIIGGLFLLAAACGSDESGDDGVGPDGGGDGDPIVDAADGDRADADPTAPDGGADPDARPTSGGDPGAAGDFDVHVVDDVSIPAGNATVTATVCSPSTDGGSAPSAGPHPLVIASPGFQLAREQYQSGCEHLASWGYTVILQTYSQSGISVDHETLAEDIGRIIDWATGPDSGMADRIDGGAIAAVGHSLGGKVSILGAILDDRVGAVVGWDPVDANDPSVTPEMMDQLTVPIAVLGETLDGEGGFMPCAPAENNYTQYFENACAAPATLEVTVEGADHMDWVDDRSSCGVTCSFCSEGSTDDAHTREITRRVTTSWLEKHLRGASGMDAYLSAPDIGSGVSLRDAPPGC